MAKALRRIEKRMPTQVEQQAESVGELIKAVSKEKDALIQFLDIVGEMKRAGLLDLMQGMLKSRKQIGVIGMHQMNKSGAQRIVRNGMGLIQFMAQLDPNQLQRVMGAVAHGLQTAEERPARGGVFGMLGNLRDPGVNASMGWMMNFLHGMGEQLPPQKH